MVPHLGEKKSVPLHPNENEKREPRKEKHCRGCHRKRPRLKILILDYLTNFGAVLNFPVLGRGD